MKYPRHDPIGFGDPRSVDDQVLIARHTSPLPVTSSSPPAPQLHPSCSSPPPLLLLSSSSSPLHLLLTSLTSSSVTSPRPPHPMASAPSLTRPPSGWTAASPAPRPTPCPVPTSRAPSALPCSSSWSSALSSASSPSCALVRLASPRLASYRLALVSVASLPRRPGEVTIKRHFTFPLPASRFPLPASYIPPPPCHVAGKKAENYFVAGRSLNLFVVTATLGSQSIDSGTALGTLDLGFLYHWYILLPPSYRLASYLLPFTSHVLLLPRWAGGTAPASPLASASPCGSSPSSSPSP